MELAPPEHFGAPAPPNIRHTRDRAAVLISGVLMFPELSSTNASSSCCGAANWYPEFTRAVMVMGPLLDKISEGTVTGMEMVYWPVATCVTVIVPTVAPI